MQKLFCQTCNNNTLKKLKHGEIKKPAIKYIIDRHHHDKHTRGPYDGSTNAHDESYEETNYDVRIPVVTVLHTSEEHTANS